jgi:hypothetical protein
MSKITESARGKNCLTRIPGVCIHDNDTVVAAHLNGAGWAIKENDLFTARACFTCHTWLDGGYVKTHTREQRDLYHLQGVIRTQKQYLDEGLITIKGES